MVAWSEYKQMAHERGSLALEMFVVVSTPSQSPDEIKSQLSSHLAYQAQLEQVGSLAFAGPLSDDTGEHMQGSGMIVYRAQSLEAARKLADADPMHESGARTYTLKRWLINEGSLSLDIRLSAQKITLS